MAITGGFVTALGSLWHNQCFKCSNCGEQFTKTGNQNILGNFIFFNYFSKIYLIFLYFILLKKTKINEMK